MIETDENKHFLSDSDVYQSLLKALTDKRLVKGIKKISAFAQTSSLEGYHSVVNQFAPKMVAYSFTGIFVRYNCHYRYN